MLDIFLCLFYHWPHPITTVFHQVGAGLRPIGICLWTTPPGGVHMAVHVCVCGDGAVQPLPPVGEPVSDLQPPGHVVWPRGLHLHALSGDGAWLSARICGDQQRVSTCLALHHHHGAGWMLPFIPGIYTEVKVTQFYIVYKTDLLWCFF